MFRTERKYLSSSPEALFIAAEQPRGLCPALEWQMDRQRSFHMVERIPADMIGDCQVGNYG